MFLTSALIVGGAIYAGLKVFEKLKTEVPPDVSLAQQDMSRQENSPQTLIANGQTPLAKVIPASLQRSSDDMGHSDSQNTPRDKDQLTEEELNHFLKVSTAAIGLNVAGSLIYAPLALLSVPVIAYTFIPVFYSAYESIFKKRRYQADIIDSMAIIVVVASGYWILAAVGGWLYFIAEKLRIKTVSQSRQNMVDLLDEQQRFAWQRLDGVELRTPLETLRVGDVIVVNDGEMIPVDGQIVDGTASIAQHNQNGAPHLAEKTVGEPVFAATVVLAGRICVRVEETGTDKLAARIGDIFHRSADSEAAYKTQAEAIAERSSLPIFGACTLAYATLGPASAVAVLCSNFGENVHLAAPISLLNFLNLASRQGILIKAGRYFEQLGKVDTVVFDQTDPLLLGQPHVRRVSPNASMTGTALLTYAAAAAYKQSSPAAKAIIQAAEEQNLALPDIDEILREVDDGITFRLDRHVVQVGSARFLALEGITVPEQESQVQGHALVYVAVDDCLGGVIELQPGIGQQTTALLSKLKQRDMSIYVISAGHDIPTLELATALGIDHYVAGAEAEDKAKLVEQLQQEGRCVCFVGDDGISNALAMQQAQSSISWCRASPTTTDAAQIILMDPSLDQLCTLFDLARAFNANMQTTLVATSSLGMVSLAGIFLLHFGILQAIILNIVGLGAGVTNAWLPAFNHESETEGKNY